MTSPVLFGVNSSNWRLIALGRTPDLAMAIPSAQPFDYRGLFRVEDERLLALLRSLTPADWHRPTPCPGWDIHGLATHLLGGSFSVISWLRDGFRGTPAPNGLDEQGFIDWLDELQATWVDAARRLSPKLLIELLEWSTKGFAEAMEAHDPESVTAHVSWAGDGPVPVWLDHARELTEKWIHRQQILESLGRPSDLRPDLGRPVMEALRWAYPYRLGPHTRQRGAFVEIEILDDQLSHHWQLVSSGSSWLFNGGTPTVMVASMSLSGDQAWRLLTNNYEEGRDGVLRTAGDPVIVETLMRTRAIIGAPK